MTICACMVDLRVVNFHAKRLKSEDYICQKNCCAFRFSALQPFVQERLQHLFPPFGWFDKFIWSKFHFMENFVVFCCHVAARKVNCWGVYLLFAQERNAAFPLSPPSAQMNICIWYWSIKLLDARIFVSQILQCVSDDFLSSPRYIDHTNKKRLDGRKRSNFF